MTEENNNEDGEHVFYDIEDIDPIIFEKGKTTTVINRKGKMVGCNSDVYFCTVAEKLGERLEG